MIDDDDVRYDDHDDDVLGMTQQLFEILSIYANIYSFQYTEIFFLIDNDNSTLSLINAD